MNTAWVLISVALVLLAVEIVSLRKEDDAWWTITATMRKLPKWAVGLVMFFVGVVFGHMYWG